MQVPLRLLSVGLVCVLTGCSESSLSSPDSPNLSVSEVVQTLNCVAQVPTRTLQCDPVQPTQQIPLTGKLRKNIIIGDQGLYVQLTSSNVNYNAGTQDFSFDATVKNLIPQPFATLDGITADSNGVRVFFSQAPVATLLTDPNGSSDISVANADGINVFTASNQIYYRFNGTELGGDSILSTNETSSAKTWTFSVNPNVEAFSFFVYVATVVPKPMGYIDLSNNAQYLFPSATQSLTGISKSAVGSVAPADVITWKSLDTTIATVDSTSGTVTGIAPGSVTLLASTRNGTRTGTTTLSVCPNLAVGEAYATSGAAASMVCLAGGAAGNAEYVAIPVNHETSLSLSTSFTASGITSVTGPPAPNRIPGRFSMLAPLGNVLDASAANQLNDIEASVLAAVNHGVPSPSRGARISSSRSAASSPKTGVRTYKAPGIRKSIMFGVPVIGDQMSLNVAPGCNGSIDYRTGTVRAISQSAIILDDPDNPIGGFTTAQYDSIAAEFDSVAYQVDTANFGAPADVDGNLRVILFYTRAVNELSAPASSAIVQGYFAQRDLFSDDPVAGCGRSNMGEIIYMMVPDPTGAVNSNVRTVPFVRGAVGSTLTHQLQHLINASRRLYVTGAPGFEEAWLDEGLSNIAVELAFYRLAMGLTPRSQIALGDLTSGPNASRRVTAFNSYANLMYGAFRSWLQRPDTSGAFRAPGSDMPGPPGIAMRGTAWAFLRYSADRTNGNEKAFWSSLVNSQLTGQANLQNAIGGVSVLDWYRDFALAMYADDIGITVAAPYKTPSWNFRSVYAGLGAFPLLARPLTNDVPLTLSIVNSGSSYLRFAVSTNSFATFGTQVSNAAPPSTLALVIMRTK